MTGRQRKHIDQARQILVSLGLPRAQQNERSAVCLLALLNLTPVRTWRQAENPLIGITPIMEWVRLHYQSVLADLGVTVALHGKMPDVVLYDTRRNWLFLVESVTSHGPVDGKRHAELAQLFAGAKAGLIYVTAFSTRTLMARYLGDIAWETEVWVAEAPSHLIHFDGERFLGPYEAP